ICELVLEREGLELGRLDPAALLARLDQRPGTFRLEQFGQLVLRQLALHTLSSLAHTGTVGPSPFAPYAFSPDVSSGNRTLNDLFTCFGGVSAALLRRRRLGRRLLGLVGLAVPRRTGREVELHLPVRREDEPGPEGLARTRPETGEDIARSPFLDQLARDLGRERAAGDLLPDHEPASGLLAALPTRAPVRTRVLADDLPRLGAAPRARAQLDPDRPELLLVQGRDLLDDLVGEVGDVVHERGAVAAAALDVGEFVLPVARQLR